MDCIWTWWDGRKASTKSYKIFHGIKALHLRIGRDNPRMVCNIYEGRRMTTSDLAMLMGCLFSNVLYGRFYGKQFFSSEQSKHIVDAQFVYVHLGPTGEFLARYQATNHLCLHRPFSSSATSPQMHPMIIMRLVTICLPVSLHFIPILLPRTTALSLLSSLGMTYPWDGK